MLTAAERKQNTNETKASQLEYQGGVFYVVDLVTSKLIQLSRSIKEVLLYVVDSHTS